jgi:hypothetical protein
VAYSSTRSIEGWPPFIFPWSVSNVYEGLRVKAFVLAWSVEVVDEPLDDVLRSIKTLETINGKPAAEFWKEQEAKKP